MSGSKFDFVLGYGVGGISGFKLAYFLAALSKGG